MRPGRLWLVAWLVILCCVAPVQAETKEEESAEQDEPERRLTHAEVIVVTPSKVEERVRDAPVAVTVIDDVAIEESGTDNYADLLRRVPGVNAVQINARDINVTPRSASGVNTRTTLGLLDGRYLNQDYFGLVLWDLMPVNFDEIKQIEVIRGPGSAIWGANALTGVINVITKSPEELQGTSGKIGGGTLSTKEFGILHAETSGDLGYKISASYFTQDAFERPTEFPDGSPMPAFENEGTNQLKVDLAWDWKQDEKSTWKFDLGYANSSGILLTFLGPFNSTTLQQTYASASYSRGNFNLHAYLNLHDAKYDGLLAPAVVKTKYATTHIEGRSKKVLGRRHVLTYGASVRPTRFDLSLTPTQDQFATAGAYLEDDMLLGKGWRVRVGARLDWFSTIGPTLSPRFGVMYEPHPNHTLRAGYNRAYIAPNLVESFVLFPSFAPVPTTGGVGYYPIVTVGNDEIEEETIDAYEIGYTGVLGRTTLTASVYYNSTEGLIHLLPVEFYTAADPPLFPPGILPGAFPLPKVFQNVNTGTQIDKGFEFSADTRVGRYIDTFFNYSYQATPQVSSDVPFAVNIPPRNRFNVGFAYTGPRIFGSMSVNYTAEAFFADVLVFEGVTDSYWMVDATVGYHLMRDSLTLKLRGVNVLDDRIQQHIFGDIISRRIVAELGFRF